MLVTRITKRTLNGKDIKPMPISGPMRPLHDKTHFTITDMKIYRYVNKRGILRIDYYLHPEVQEEDLEYLLRVNWIGKKLNKIQDVQLFYWARGYETDVHQLVFPTNEYIAFLRCMERVLNERMDTSVFEEERIKQHLKGELFKV